MAPTKYDNPLAIEEVGMNHPDVRVCLLYFAWPWVCEMVMLMLKYSNLLYGMLGAVPGLSRGVHRAPLYGRHGPL